MLTHLKKHQRQESACDLQGGVQLLFVTRLVLVGTDTTRSRPTSCFCFCGYSLIVVSEVYKKKLVGFNTSFYPKKGFKYMKETSISVLSLFSLLDVMKNIQLFRKLNKISVIIRLFTKSPRPHN